jgi:hypothetical protein
VEAYSSQSEIRSIENIVPTSMHLTANPLQRWPPNNNPVSVKVYGTTSDIGSGTKNIHVQVIDECGPCRPAIMDIGPGYTIDIGALLNTKWPI